MTDLTTPRPVPTREDRMRDARTDDQTADVQELLGALRRTDAEQQTSFATYLDRHERADLDARAATAEQERDDALDDLQAQRTQLQLVTQANTQHTARIRQLEQERNDSRNLSAQILDDATNRLERVAAERDEALEARDVLRAQLDTARAELADAQELLAVVDDLAEQLDRARARYATRQQEQGTDDRLGSPEARAQDEPEREEVRWAYRWIGRDGQVYDEMDASDNAIETAEQRAHRIAAKHLTGTVRGEVLRYRVLTMPAEVVATYPFEDPA